MKGMLLFVGFIVALFVALSSYIVFPARLSGKYFAHPKIHQKDAMLTLNTDGIFSLRYKDERSQWVAIVGTCSVDSGSDRIILKYVKKGRESFKYFRILNEEQPIVLEDDLGVWVKE